MTPYQKHIEDWLAGRVEGAILPIRITGTHDHPAFKIDVRWGGGLEGIG